MITRNHKKIGDAGEDAAAEYVKRRGMRILERNYHSRHGEIDLIAQDGKTTVFLEVKTRQGQRFGPPEEAITPAKMRAMIYTATCYAKQKGLLEQPMRFDVAAVRMNQGECTIDYYENVEMMQGE